MSLSVVLVLFDFLSEVERFLLPVWRVSFHYGLLSLDELSEAFGFAFPGGFHGFFFGDFLHLFFHCFSEGLGFLFPCSLLHGNFFNFTSNKASFLFLDNPSLLWDFLLMEEGSLLFDHLSEIAGLFPPWCLLHRLFGNFLHNESSPFLLCNPNLLNEFFLLASLFELLKGLSSILHSFSEWHWRLFPAGFLHWNHFSLLLYKSLSLLLNNPWSLDWLEFFEIHLLLFHCISEDFGLLPPWCLLHRLDGYCVFNKWSPFDFGLHNILDGWVLIVIGLILDYHVSIKGFIHFFEEVGLLFQLLDISNLTMLNDAKIINSNLGDWYVYCLFMLSLLEIVWVMS